MGATEIPIKDRSYKCYDYKSVVSTQEDAARQARQWQIAAGMLDVGTSHYLKCIAKVAYWKSIVDAQLRVALEASR